MVYKNRGKTHSQGYYNKHRAGLPLKLYKYLSPQCVHFYKINNEGNTFSLPIKCLTQYSVWMCSTLMKYGLHNKNWQYHSTPTSMHFHIHTDVINSDFSQKFPIKIHYYWWSNITLFKSANHIDMAVHSHILHF